MSGARILAVDDERDALEALSEMLGAWGHRVETATDGNEALKKALEFRPDLVLSDLSMPGMDGLFLLRAIRDELPDTPLVFLHNITGFMVGSKAEQGGIIRNGAKLINAVSNSGVPHFCLMVGASYGAGNYGMSGRAYDPRFIFSWPNHRIAVMGGRQLAGVMDIVARNAATGRGVEALMSSYHALD